MFETDRAAGVLRVRRAGTAWLSSGWNGGRWDTGPAYNLTVPEGWQCEAIDAYVANRLDEAGFDDPGPTLLTGVDQRHARGARCGPVEAYATAGLSNPAALPMDPSGGALPDGRLRCDSNGHREDETDAPTVDGPDGAARGGTVNLIVGTRRALDGGALASFLSTVAEAKTATLLAETGFTGTTTDAIVVGHDPTGPRAEYAGSATPVGAAARACVREALLASLDARYDTSDQAIPPSVEDARHGVSTDVRAEVFEP